MPSGDYTWDQMPEELALQLHAFAEDPSDKNAGELSDWLLNEMKQCAATPKTYLSLRYNCSDLPVPGSEFCSAHLPKEDIDGN